MRGRGQPEEEEPQGCLPGCQGQGLPRAGAQRAGSSRPGAALPALSTGPGLSKRVPSVGGVDGEKALHPVVSAAFQ